MSFQWLDSLIIIWFSWLQHLQNAAWISNKMSRPSDTRNTWRINVIAVKFGQSLYDFWLLHLYLLSQYKHTYIYRIIDQLSYSYNILSATGHKMKNCIKITCKEILSQSTRYMHLVLKSNSILQCWILSCHANFILHQ